MIRKEKLVELALELNRSMGLNPPIEPDELSLSQVREKVNGAVWMLEPFDRLSVNGVLLLDELNLLPIVRAAQQSGNFPLAGHTRTRWNEMYRTVSTRHP